MGMSFRDIVYGIGGGIEGDKALKAIQVGGPSGGIIPTSMLDLGLDYENLAKVGSIVGSGGMVVFDEDDCIVSVTKFYMEFLQRESCGKCTPCRVGTKRMMELLTKITEGTGGDEDLRTLERLSGVMASTSLCGLGQERAESVPHELQPLQGRIPRPHPRPEMPGRRLHGAHHLFGQRRALQGLRHLQARMPDESHIGRAKKSARHRSRPLHQVRRVLPGVQVQGDQEDVTMIISPSP